MAKIAVVGIGIMGGPIVTMLRRAGHTVGMHSRSPSTMQPYLRTGATIADSLEDAVREAEFVLTTLPTNPIVAEVYEQFASVAVPGQVFIEHSTITPQLSRSLSSLLECRGAQYLDAPVSGGPEGVLAGSLAIFVGGSEVAFDHAHPVLRAYGGMIRLCGAAGAGTAMKLLSQLLVAAHTVAASEAIAFGERMGLSLPLMREMIMASSGRSAMFDRTIQRVSEKRFADAARGPMRLTLKDTKTVAAAATQCGLELGVFDAARTALVRAEAAGLAELDVAAVAMTIQRNAAVNSE